ncbi:Drosophila melanogaster CG5222 gene product [Babesia ovata]|uniref:Drosophila melanogaster CG5222 gene product n=1 Tax=Babesia ovata TaxID=189622 RepID=A0A2H6KAJ6_9APIC|nr:Drosophila melanogaster CG5222 gene product [Babesia ovata]GBE60021.1 Drosophila melanogaster CG5222 gene product [Babesia ovata]
MEVRVICDCTDCSSRLVEIGGVNVLCNLPTRLLKQCKRELKQSYFCHSKGYHNQELYAKLLCLNIHIIVVTTPRGLDGLDTLRKFYDLSSTHIVCTRPVYTIASLAAPRTVDDSPIAAIATDVKNVQQNYRNTRASVQGRNGGLDYQETPRSALREMYYDDDEDDYEEYVQPYEGYNGVEGENRTWLTLESVGHMLPINGGRGDDNTRRVDQIMRHGVPETQTSRLNSQEAKDALAYSVRKALIREKIQVLASASTKGMDRPTPLEAWFNTPSSHSGHMPFGEQNTQEERFNGRGGRYNDVVEQPMLKDPNLPNTQLLHAVSYNEIVTIVIDGASVYKRNRRGDRSRSMEAFFDRSRLIFKATIELCAFSSGFSLGSSNWTITHAETFTRVGLIGETGEIEYNRYCKPPDLSFVYKADMLVLLDNAVAARNLLQHFKMDPHLRRDIKRQRDDLQNAQLDNLCKQALEGLQNAEGVVIVADPYGETILDLLEHLELYMQKYLKHHERVLIYALGEGMVNILNYADKCAEWVEPRRADRTMHHENPTSPFTVLAEMREGNRLFIGNTTDDIRDVYRYPSIVVATYDQATIPYLAGRMHAGATMIATTVHYSDELLHLATEMGIQARIMNVTLDFRVLPEHLALMLGTKCQIIVSKNMKGRMPHSLKLIPGDNVRMPIAGPSGLLSTDTRAEHISRALARMRPMVRGSGAVPVHITVADGELQQATPINVPDDEPRFTFGTFTPMQLIERLRMLGLGHCELRNPTNGYPMEIIVDEECLIILESPYETSIHTASQEKRRLITRALEQLCTVL